MQASSSFLDKISQIGDFGATIASPIISFVNVYFKPISNLKINSVHINQINEVVNFASKVGPALNTLASIVSNPISKIATSGLAIAADMLGGKTPGESLAHVNEGILTGLAGGGLVAGVATLAGVTAPAWSIAGAAIGAAYLFEKHYEDPNSILRKSVDNIGRLFDTIKHYDGDESIPPLKPYQFIPLPPYQ